MDHCRVSADTFDRHAENYARKYLGPDIYDAYYEKFCSHLPQSAEVLDAACGPGNVSAFLARARPDLRVLGIDLAPNMITLARTHVPSARFLVHDCRHIAELNRVFDGIASAFGLPYLDPAETEGFFQSLDAALAPAGVLYLSTMTGPGELSGLETSSGGDQVYIHYRPRQEVEQLVQDAGLEIICSEEIASPASAPKSTTDIVLIARRTAR